METPSLTSLQIWTLLACTRGPKHLYAIQANITGLTLRCYNPNRSSVRRAAITLARRKLLHSTLYNSRVEYEITSQGWATLQAEHRLFARLDNAIERALTNHTLLGRIL